MCPLKTVRPWGIIPQLSYRVAGSTLPAGAAGIAEDGAGGLPRGETVMSIFEPPRVFFVIWIVAMRLSRL